MKVMSLLRFVARRFADDLLTIRAQSLTYTTILSMVPLLAVMFSVLKAFGIHNQVEPMLAQGLAPLGPEGAEIATQLVSFVDNMRVGVLGAIGVAGLFYTTISLIGQIEHSLNAIFRVRRPRSVAEQFRDYLAIVLVGPVLVFTAFAMTASAENHWIVQRLLAVPGVGRVLPVGARLVPLAFLAAAFTLLYEFLPRTPVRWGAAALGGVVAAVLWHVAGLAFTAFVASSTRYTAIYSSFAILIVFLIWLYLSWLIVLIGGEVTYFAQYPRFLRNAAPERVPALSEAAALRLAVATARRHLAGEPPQGAAALARDLGLPLEVVEDFVDALVRCGVLLRSAEPPGIALARAPAQVRSGEILDAVRGAAPAADGPIGALLAERDRAVRAAVDETTLEMLAKGAQEPEVRSQNSEARSQKA